MQQLKPYKNYKRTIKQNVAKSINTNFKVPINKCVDNYFFGPNLLNDDYNLLDILPNCGDNFETYRRLIGYFNNYNSNLSRLVFYASVDDVISSEVQFYNLQQDLNDPEVLDTLYDLDFPDNYIDKIGDCLISTT